MVKKITFSLSCLVALCMFPTVWAVVSLQIDSVVVNENYTHDVSNDTSYFYGTTGQNATVDVTISSMLGDSDANATVGMYLINETGDIVNPGNVFQNRTVLVPLSGKNTTQFTWNINATTTLSTGRYNITVFVEYPFNSTENRTIYHRSEYINLVSLQVGRFWMFHEDNATTAGDEVEFRQAVTNTGTNTASARFKVDVEWDDGADGVCPCTVYPIGSGGYFSVEPGETITKSFKWNMTGEDDCSYAVLYEWEARSEFSYGYSKVNGETPTPNGIQNVTIRVEDIVEGSGTSVYREEYAPGDLIESIYWAANAGETNATVHEAKAWIEDENGNVVLNMSTFNDPRSVPSNGQCPPTMYYTNYNFDGVLPLSLSASVNHKLIMGIDYGVPRGTYIQTDIFPYAGFNEKFEGSFQLVDARMRNIYSMDEVAYGVAAKFDSEVENIGINKIDEAPTIDFIISNESVGYSWNWTLLVNLNAGQKKNSTIYWTPKSGEVPLGSYNVTATYKFGAAGTSSKSGIISVVALGIINVTSPVVTPYETVNITALVQDMGPTNATVSSIETTIETNNTTITVGKIENKEVSNTYNQSFSFSYTLTPISGVVNGSYPIYADLSYGGTSFSNTFSNIALLPVGIKSFSAPSQGNNETSFISTLVLRNIANSSVSVSLNLSSNLSGEINATNVILAAGSTTTLNYNVTLPQEGIHNLTITANYSGLPAPLTRNAIISISGQRADLTISSSDISFSPSSPTSGQNVTISTTVRNTGFASASSFIVELRIDGMSQENKTVSVFANSSTAVQFTWTAITGTYDVTIVLDPTNIIAGEVSETNNNATVSLTVTAPVTVSGGGGGGGGPPPPTTEPAYIKSDVELTGRDIADMVYDTGDALVATKYIIHPKFASLAGVLAAHGAVVLSPETGTFLFEIYEDSKSGNIIKEAPALLEAGVYELAADHALATGGADIIVVSRGDIEVDSLAASTFTSLIDGRMLLVKPEEVPYPTLQALEKLRPTRVYIIGGEEAISPEVEKVIGEYTFRVERIGGKDRYETSLKLAKKVQERSGTTIVVVTDGRKPAIYAASLAVKFNSPLVYVDEYSPEETGEFLKDFKVKAKLY